MINRRLLSLDNIYLYGLTLVIPLGCLHLSTAYFIADVNVEAISIIFPSLAVLALVLELGISQFLVASKIRSRDIVSFLFTDSIFHYAYFALICIVFFLSGFVIGEASYYELEVFLSFILYVYSGFFLSISRGIVDRSRRRDLAISLRIISNIGVAGAVIIAYFGFEATWSFCFCALIRISVAGPFIFQRFLQSIKNKGFLKSEMRSDLRKTILKLSANGMTVFIIGGLISRSVWLALAASSAFSIYVIAAEFCSRISGFLLNALQPFFHVVIKRLLIFDILSCFLAIFALALYENRLSSILALSIILVTTGLKLQALLIYERHLFRITFPFFEFLVITFTFLLLKGNFQADLELVNSWVIGQLVCSLLCSIYLRHLKREHEF